MEIANIIIDTVIDGFTINYAPLEEHVYSSLEEVCLQILLLSGGPDELEIAEISIRDVYRLQVVTIAKEMVAVHKNEKGEVALMPIHRIPVDSKDWVYRPIHRAAKGLASLLEAK